MKRTVLRFSTALLALALAGGALAQPDPEKDPKKAAKKYGKLAEKSPDNPDNWYNLAFANCLLGEWSEAVPAARRAVELLPESAEYRYVLGFALNGSGDAEGAVESLERAVEIDPGLTKAQVSLAKAYSAAGLHEKAIPALKAALKTKPENAGELYVDLGNAYLDAGDTDSAVRWFKRSTEDEPDSAVAWFNLGVVLRRLANREPSLGPESAEAFAKAADLAPRDADSLFMAGLSAFMVDQYATAEKYLEAFLKVEPDTQRSADARVYLGEIQK